MKTYAELERELAIEAILETVAIGLDSFWRSLDSSLKADDDRVPGTVHTALNSAILQRASASLESKTPSELSALTSDASRLSFAEFYLDELTAAVENLFGTNKSKDSRVVAPPV